MALDVAGIKAVSDVLSTFGEKTDAAQKLGDQLKKLSDSMGLKDVKSLIFEMERLNKITSDQARELLALNDAQEKRTKKLEDEKEALKEAEKYSENLTKKWKDFGYAIASGDLPGAIGKISSGIRAIGGPLAVTTAAIMDAPSAIINLGKSIESMVAKANPAAAFQFNRALDDLVATLGQILTPILDGVTSIIRGFADVLQGLKPLFMILTETIGEFLKFIGSAIEAVADLLGSKGKSVGAAVRPAAYGSIADIGKRTTLNVLNQGRGGLTPDGESTKSGLGKVVEELKNGFKSVTDAIGDRTGQGNRGGASNFFAEAMASALNKEFTGSDY